MMEEIIFSPSAALKEPFSIVPVAGATQLKSPGKNKCVLRIVAASPSYLSPFSFLVALWIFVILFFLALDFFPPPF